MFYKPDWEEAKARLLAWWRGEGLSLCVYAPREQPLWDGPRPALPADPRDRWLDAEFRVQSAEYKFAHTFYGGDAFPDANLYLGPGCMALYLGCDGDFSACTGEFEGTDTIWFRPFIADPDSAGPIGFDEHNYYWGRHLEMIRLALDRAAGRFRVSIPVLVNNLDMLAYVRGSTALLSDLVERPAWVHRAQRQILELYFRYYDRIYDLVKDAGGGCSQNGFQVWALGRITRAGCDHAAMISPRMFREFVLPYVAEECERVDYALFHLDGPECIRHVDALLEIPSLRAIQWSPKGEGCGSSRWYPLYDKIRAAGRSLQLRGVRVAEIEPLLKRYGPNGMQLWITAGSESEAREVLHEYCK